MQFNALHEKPDFAVTLIRNPSLHKVSSRLINIVLCIKNSKGLSKATITAKTKYIREAECNFLTGININFVATLKRGPITS